MIQIYKSISETDSTLKQLDSIENGCWINIVAPSDEELILISKKTGVPLSFLRAPLDDEETSRIDVEDEFTLVVVDIPFTEMEDNSLTYDTYPLAIIHSEKEIITVCLKNSRIITDFINGRVKSFFSFKKSRFILQILNRISTYYLIYLRQIDKKSVAITLVKVILIGNVWKIFLKIHNPYLPILYHPLNKPLLSLIKVSVSIENE